MNATIIREGVVCTDCANVIANGTGNGPIREDGREHYEAHAADNMSAGDFVLTCCEPSDCDFDHDHQPHRDFSGEECMACGTTLAGDRCPAVEFASREQESFIRTATEHYLIAALWSECDEDGDPLDGTYGPDDLAPAARTESAADVADFVISNWTDLRTMSPEQAGHDFLLTRNRHGAGFWDRGLGEVGDRLTAACKPYGEASFYVGDDGLIYVA